MTHLPDYKRLRTPVIVRWERLDAASVRTGMIKGSFEFGSRRSIGGIAAIRMLDSGRWITNAPLSYTRLYASVCRIVPEINGLMTTSLTPLNHADRQALGLRARKQIARSEHANFQASACPHDPLDLLRASMRDRVARLVPIKYQRMVASPFGFFRGAVPIMAADLACHPNTGITTQLCGDAHVLNLGAFAAPDGRLVFDINDFDETIRGPFEYDVKRLATSLILAGREAGVKRAARRDAVLHFTEQYRSMMHTFAAMPVLELARYQIHRLAETEPMPAILAQAGRSTPQKSLKTLTEPRAAKTQQHRSQRQLRATETLSLRAASAGTPQHQRGFRRPRSAWSL